METLRCTRIVTVKVVIRRTLDTVKASHLIDLCLTTDNLSPRARSPSLQCFQDKSLVSFFPPQSFMDRCNRLRYECLVSGPEALKENGERVGGEGGGSVESVNRHLVCRTSRVALDNWHKHCGAVWSN